MGIKKCFKKILNKSSSNKDIENTNAASYDNSNGLNDETIHMRAKFYALILKFLLLVLAQVTLVSLHLKGKFNNANWIIVLIPFWIWNLSMLSSAFLMMNKRAEEKRDQLLSEQQDWNFIPAVLILNSRLMFIRFFLLFAFEVMVVARIDGFINWTWSCIFIPLFMADVALLIHRLPKTTVNFIIEDDLDSSSNSTITTTDSGNDYNELKLQQKHNEVNYIFLCSGKLKRASKSLPDCEYLETFRGKCNAKRDIVQACSRITFMILLTIQLDSKVQWSWWFIFAPFFIVPFVIYYIHYHNVVQLQEDLTDMNRFQLSTLERESIEAKIIEEYNWSLCFGVTSFILLCFFVWSIQVSGWGWIINISLIVSINVLLCIIGCICWYTFSFNLNNHIRLKESQFQQTNDNKCEHNNSMQIVGDIENMDEKHYNPPCIVIV